MGATAARLRPGRLALALAFGVIGAVLAGCSGGGLTVKTSGASYAARATGVACVPANGSVTVSGTLTATGVASGIGPSATVYDSTGNQIGNGEGPWHL
jgi:hypothetical protein